MQKLARNDFFFNLYLSLAAYTKYCVLRITSLPFEKGKGKIKKCLAARLTQSDDKSYWSWHIQNPKDNDKLTDTSESFEFLRPLIARACAIEIFEPV